MPALDIEIGNDQSICEGDQATFTIQNLDPNTAYTFDWNNGGTSESITVSTGGRYEVFVSDGDGCAGFDTVHLTVNPNPVPTPIDAAICEGESATLDAGLSGMTYSWDSGASTQTINVTTGGIYTVTVTDVNGCVGTQSATLTVNAKPILPTIADQVACAGTAVEIDPSLPLGTYYWKPTAETTSGISVTTAGTYELVVTTPQGCKDSTTTNVGFNVLPVVDLGPDIAVCQGQTARFGFDPGNNLFNWNVNVNRDSVLTDTAGTYILSVTDDLGCTGKDTINVSINPNPLLSVSPDTTLCLLDVGYHVLDVFTDLRNEIEWSTGETDKSITVFEDGLYTVNVTNEQGCSSSDSVMINRQCITRLFVPNAFSPNGDGINDKFGAVGFNVYDYEFYVFNRWGEQIFSTNNIDEMWDGTYMGNTVQIDVYVWKAYWRSEEENGVYKRHQMVGTVTVVR